MPAPARVPSARGVAFDLLLRIETRNSFSAELLHSNLLTGLSAADRNLATELVMGTLRWQLKLDAAVQDAAGKPIAKFDIEVKIALRLGAYQLLFLDRIPPRAAVNESVELVKLHGKRSAAPLVNAVLRRVAALLVTTTSVPDSAAGMADRFSHPLWIVERWLGNYGLEATRGICEYNQQRPRTTIRFVRPQGSPLAQTSSLKTPLLEELASEHIELEAASFVNDAWHVVRGDVTQTAAYREHRLAIQDEASQLVGLLGYGRRILDCCAAPGGKSAIAAERNPGALIVSMDLYLHRVRLMRRLKGVRTVLVGDARLLPLAQSFDCVIADLPCTGTGTLSRNPEVKWRLKADDLPRLATLQLEILRSVAALTKRIVFSTCSLEREEGEQVVTEFLAAHRDFHLFPMATRLEQLAKENSIHPPAIGSLLNGNFLRIIPGSHRCDGFFAAILQSD